MSSILSVSVATDGCDFVKEKGVVRTSTGCMGRRSIVLCSWVCVCVTCYTYAPVIPYTYAQPEKNASWMSRADEVIFIFAARSGVDAMPRVGSVPLEECPDYLKDAIRVARQPETPSGHSLIIYDVYTIEETLSFLAPEYATEYREFASSVWTKAVASVESHDPCRLACTIVHVW